RRLDGVRAAVLFLAVPLLLVAATVATAAGVSPFPPGSILARATPIVSLAVLLGYVVVLVLPRYGLIEAVTTVASPRDPEEAMTAGARGFAAQMQVAIEAFECAQAQLPPTSPGEISGTEEEAS